VNIIEAMSSPKLFGQWFKRKLLRGDTWISWRVFLKALFALPLDADELPLYTRHTGRSDVPTEQAREAWLICSRRSGKSLISGFIAVFLACFRSYEDMLAPGEVATVMVIACDKRQARVVLGYINGFFDTVATLGRMVASRTKESITLVNRVRIEVHTASFRAVRGYSIAAVILDEIAFFPTGDSAEPDFEIVNALRPAMATIPDALLLALSSPYARRGVLYEAYKENFGKANAPALVWKAATKDMNPTVSQATITMAYLRDAASATAEFGGEFRSDIEGFLTLELVEAAMVHKRELPPVSGTYYSAFVDPSGGQSDSFTLGIAHTARNRVVLDVLREVAAPFQPEKVVAEFADVLRQYRCSEVTGDRYGGEWPREQFEKRGIAYRLSERTRSELYLEMLPLLTGGVAELQDSPRLKAQLVSLERRTARSGKDSIDHPPGGHDDLANAAAGVLVLAAAQMGGSLGLVELYKCAHADARLRNQLFDPYNSPRPNSPVYGEMDRDHACVRCKVSPVKKIAHDTYECPACATRFTVGIMPPTGTPGRTEAILATLAPSDAMPRGAWRNGFERGVFGRFGKR